MPSETALVFDVQHFCLRDGPGIRTTVFLKGCPLRCLWCQNPEGQAPRPEIVFDPDACAACGRCAQACPARAVDPDDPGRIQRDLCRGCGACTPVCSGGARRLAGEYVEPGQLVTRVRKDAPFYAASGGGVTFSGGEPLAQASALLGLLRSFKALGVHTCVETSGYSGWNSLATGLPYTDHLFFDLKAVDDTLHRAVTGRSNRRILSNARRLVVSGTPLTFRAPLIPGINDGTKGLADLAAFLRDLQVDRVEVVPYHRLGGGKYRLLGRSYPLGEIGPYRDDDLRAKISFLGQAGLRVAVNGREDLAVFTAGKVPGGAIDECRPPTRDSGRE